MKFGNEPGVQKMALYQAGSSQHKPRLRVTNVMAHGPGIKLLNGLAEASTNGVAIYAYRCRLLLLNIPSGRMWTMLPSSSLLLWNRPAGGLPGTP